MERRSILEKLGLIEKIESEQDGNEKEQFVENIENTVPSVSVTVETERPQFTGYEKREEVKETAQPSVYQDDSEDPCAIVRKNKLLSIEDIYKNYDINTEGINSLSIVESFQKALPDYLPTDVKRQSILNIIASSNVKVEALVKDGNDKLNGLKEFSRSFTSESNDVISNFEDEIKKLNEKINKYKAAIDNMKKFQSEQDFTVKYEIDKINNILQFLNLEI